MAVLRKVASATRLLRGKGLSAVGELARIRAAELYVARRPLPADPARRAT